MAWNFEVLRDLTAKRFNIDKDFIGYGDELDQLGIDPEEYADFLLTLKDVVEQDGVFRLKDEGNLRLEVNNRRTLNYFVENIVR